MKSLELQNFGVVEMNTEEMREIDGGGVKKKILDGVKWLVGLMVEELIENPNAFTSPNAHTTPYGHMGGARP